jgi:hypothetical protein
MTPQDHLNRAAQHGAPGLYPSIHASGWPTTHWNAMRNAAPSVGYRPIRDTVAYPDPKPGELGASLVRAGSLRRIP